MKVAWGRSEQDAKAFVLNPKLLPQFLGDGLKKGLLKYGRPSIIYDAFELALVEINWQESDTYLIEMFAAWLHGNRPRGIQIYEDRGAGNFRRRLHDELKALGAWRLLEKMSWTEAFTESFEMIGRKTRKDEGVGLYGNREQNWKKAKRKAETIIQQMKKWALISAAKDSD